MRKTLTIAAERGWSVIRHDLTTTMIASRHEVRSWKLDFDPSWAILGNNGAFQALHPLGRDGKLLMQFGDTVNGKFAVLVAPDGTLPAWPDMKLEEWLLRNRIWFDNPNTRR